MKKLILLIVAIALVAASAAQAGQNSVTIAANPTSGISGATTVTMSLKGHVVPAVVFNQCDSEADVSQSVTWTKIHDLYVASNVFATPTPGRSCIARLYDASDPSSLRYLASVSYTSS